jgi:hypothetical protein
MALVYRKTSKGLSEIETRANRLVPRLRSALILVDGRRSGEELHKLILAQSQETFAALLEQGYIELVAGPSPKPALRDTSGTPTSPGTPSIAPGRAGSTLGPFEKHRREAVRYLNDHLGPMGEVVAIRIEKSHDWADLRRHLEAGAQMLQAARSSAAGREFVARYVDTLP